MTKVIGFSNQKGGVGKTTLSVNLAYEYSQRGLTVLLVDADPQGSALDWAAARVEHTPFAVVGMAKPLLHKEIPKIAHNFDLIIIDGPPRVTDITRSMTMVCDALFIPVQPSPYDIWAAQDTVELIDEAQIVKPDLQAFFIHNRVIKNTVIARDVELALLDYEGTRPLDTVIYNRVAYSVSVQEGAAVGELAHAVAKQEIKALADEIKTWLGFSQWAWIET